MSELTQLEHSVLIHYTIMTRVRLSTTERHLLSGNGLQAGEQLLQLDEQKIHGMFKYKLNI